MRKAIDLIMSIHTRLGFCIIGIYWMNKKKIHLDYNNYPKLRPVEDHQVVVSNHSSWVDILYFMTQGKMPNFLAKEEVSNYLIIGFIAKILQCLFVNRFKDVKSNTIDQILRRVDNIKRYPDNYRKLLIFPEGTTTNN